VGVAASTDSDEERGTWAPGIRQSRTESYGLDELFGGVDVFNKQLRVAPPLAVTIDLDLFWQSGKVHK
jgi:hypothetical protein